MTPTPSRTIIRNAAKCRRCGDVVESKEPGQIVYCRCRSIAVDGGRDYLRRVGAEKDIEELSEEAASPREKEG